MQPCSILLVGRGQMGSALLHGWQKHPELTVLAIDPGAADGVQCFAEIDALPASFTPDVVVLAIKPQVMAQVAPAYARYKNAAFLSIAAGISLENLAEYLGQNAAIVRAMPNLPATVAAGVTACVPSEAVQPEQLQQIELLLNSVGATYWLEEENLMDAVTAVSGSGPAYVFYFVEALAEAGRKIGLPEELADHLALHTVIGSGCLLQHSKESPQLLRKSVTSPGGTTEAALRVLMGNDGLLPLLEKAVAAADKRSVELRGIK